MFQNVLNAMQVDINLSYEAYRKHDLIEIEIFWKYFSDKKC